ncbi:hypothetical protein C9374_006308 [Naegleria lovaniensis]|uniref:Uncharacterized protein n=1 Tax=Naegleria lovaniensis TaxID=51637 RepID=A0AA88KH30_NAELO|nr:uncharacterized protein C9374_006308 [Naegleria lovaniensis]KAG2381319.1 hypothetical protein C9374_006308 [Naegleria lovaniensis]
MRCFEDSDHDMIDSYWLGAVSMIQVAWYFKKQQQLQKLQLVRGDLTPEQCLEIAKLQFIMISEERGEFSQYEDIVDSDSLVSGYVSKMDIETLQNETTMEEVKENFVRRISHLIITTEKFEKMKRKMPTLSSYELFMFRAQICCLDMMNDLYLKRGSTQVESCGEQFYVHEYNKGSSNWKSFFPFHSSKILKKLHPVEHLNNYLAVTITLRNYIHFGSTQFSQHLQFVEIELSLKSVDEIENLLKIFWSIQSFQMSSI